ncbi:uncharacterized protein LOC135146035 [Zophobas morio]|uniref:uncharacterized protein LOC135146035 n=1 Tax=Zophobas morio TaxID=2755281 RepID=UPI0030833FA0
MPVHTELYDLLGVSPEATDSEIRKGYLIQARKWHPDRCSTTDCEERFKNISEAYKILSDHDLKLIYDQSGLKDVKVAQQQAGFDVVEQTKETVRALFGFGKFETLFGDVTTLPLFVNAIHFLSNSLSTSGKALEADESIKLSLERKEKEEAERQEELLTTNLAYILKAKVKPCLGGPEEKEAFKQLIYYEAVHLCSFPGGKDLLGCVAYIYKQEAKQHLKRFLGVEGFISEVAEKKHVLGQKLGIASHAVRLMVTTNKLQREMDKEEKLKLQGQEVVAALVESSPSSDLAQSSTVQNSGRKDSKGFSVPPDGLESTTVKQQQLLEEIFSQGLTAFWKLGKYLLEERVRKACEKMMALERNPDVRNREIEAVLEIGEIYDKVSRRSKRHNTSGGILDYAHEKVGLRKS